MTTKWRVCADVPAATRALIIRVHKPRFSDVYCRSITWAHGVEQHFPFDDDEQDVTLIGLHRGHDTEAFSLRIGNATHRGDDSTQALFLALSCAHKIPPFSAGTFDPADTRSIRPIRFKARLVQQPMFHHSPRPNPTQSDVA